MTEYVVGPVCVEAYVSRIDCRTLKLRGLRGIFSQYDPEKCASLAATSLSNLLSANRHYPSFKVVPLIAEKVIL